MTFINITPIAVSSDEVLANKPSFAPALSGDGRYVVFASDADNLVAGDTNGARDIFVRDTLTGTTRLVSAGVGGISANGGSSGASISDDGRFVVFGSAATNLVANDSGAGGGTLLRDLLTGTTSRLSVTAAGADPSGMVSSAIISGNGRFVAVHSGDSVFLKDLQTGSAQLVSLPEDQARDDAFSYPAGVSKDGRYVIFNRRTDDLTSGGDPIGTQVYLRDTLLGTTKLVSANASGMPMTESPDNSCYGGGISDDGRYVVFTHLTYDDAQIYVRDTVLGTTEQVSVSADGSARGDDFSYGADISADGRFVVFRSQASNLVAGESNSIDVDRIYLRDLETGVTRKLTYSTDGVRGVDAFEAHFSADGRYIVIRTGDLHPIPGDTEHQTSGIVRVSLFVTNDNDYLIGTNASETISGLGGSDTIFGARGDDKLVGGTGSDDLSGGNGDDRLYGENGNDSLRGDRGNDLLKGGAGADKLWGGIGLGHDTFVFSRLTDSTVSSEGRDTIYDFAKGDRFDLSALDANTGKSGNQAFGFIGTDKFSGKAGELRFEEKVYGTAVYADVNGDKKVDFAFNLDDAIKLVKADFLL